MCPFGINAEGRDDSWISSELVTSFLEVANSLFLLLGTDSKLSIGKADNILTDASNVTKTYYWPLGCSLFIPFL